jgi:hypothetical protein
MGGFRRSDESRSRLGSGKGKAISGSDSLGSTDGVPFRFRRSGREVGSERVVFPLTSPEGVGPASKPIRVDKVSSLMTGFDRFAERGSDL